MNAALPEGKKLSVSNPANKVTTYQWTPEETKKYLADKYPDLKKPEGKKPSGAWQTKNKK